MQEVGEEEDRQIDRAEASRPGRGRQRDSEGGKTETMRNRDGGGRIGERVINRGRQGWKGDWERQK